MRPGVPEVRITDPLDSELATYRPLSGQAVAGLIFGLLAPLALVDPLLWGLPLLGAIFSFSALRRIHREQPALGGRKIALAGLYLALFFGVLAPSDWFVYRRLVWNEARQFSALWFQYLAQDQPQLAHQMVLPPATRYHDSQHLWDFYRNNPRLREQLEGYVAMPLVRTLLALGPGAVSRFYDTVAQSREDGNDQVELLYAVTFEEEGERKSFFVSILCERQRLADGTAQWRILNTAGGVRPQSRE